VTAMTMRNDAVYRPSSSGKPPQEDAWLGKATERIFLPAIRRRSRRSSTTTCGVRRVPQLLHRLDPQGVPGHAHKVMHAIWGLGMLSLTKCIVVVDAHVDVHDYAQVLFLCRWRTSTRRAMSCSRAGRSTISTTRRSTSSSAASSASTPPQSSWRRGAAVAGGDRMSAEIKALVDRRWEEYGIRTGSFCRERLDRSDFAFVAPTATTLTPGEGED